MAITQEQVDEFNLRTLSNNVQSFMFRIEPKPGVLKFVTIHIGKTYKINRPGTKISGRIVRVLNFIYPLKTEINSTTPLGVEVLFLDRNTKGTYYDIGELEEISE